MDVIGNGGQRHVGDGVIQQRQQHGQRHRRHGPRARRAVQAFAFDQDRF